MEKRGLASRRELLDRWRVIEEEEELFDDDDPSYQRRLHQHKEQWFADSFNFLINLPKDDHMWCGSWDIMGPLLETFYNYYKDERRDSPLKILWKRMSEEMQHCIQCVSQHHQAQEMYSREYELSTIGPLLDVLRTLDEERVTQCLKDINVRLACQEYNPQIDNSAVVSLMYEVFMYPVLLDDHALFTEFEIFIEAVDKMHELALAGDQQFPGVFALLFFNRKVRSIGRRLAKSMGKLRRATDLEQLQPLLRKCISLLETEVLPSTLKTSRPRAHLERLPIWLGITSLLEFLEPPALEEGILENYPIFFDIVLNHISGDSPEFSHAVSCLRELFKMLGYKLWLRSTLSPSVMRNTLLGQCFHTRNEKIHKDIFDLFLPFLQSLEALQDGEHEKQRRNFLYFLLHQVSASSNFSILTTKLACKIALLIVLRGYKMNPPCPPSECAHMWGPSLVSSLKDASLHSSLRQPAFDLIQIILVSDAAALITSIINSARPLAVDKFISMESSDDLEDCSLPVDSDIGENDNDCWSGFSVQNKITSSEYRGWLCIPMLWIDVLVDINPSILPVSFSKAVFWARSRVSMVEPEISAELALDIKSWLTLSATEISPTFGWKVPTGCDDGGGGKVSKNSMEVSTMCLPLIRAFKRLTAHFIVQIGQGELRKQWLWEPGMGESLILLLVDSNDNVRQCGKSILEQVSNTRGLACGLKFLCSNGASLSAIFLGFRHGLKLVQLDSVLLKFQTLHHFFFVLRKVYEEGNLTNSNLLENSSDGSSVKEFSSQGGFLRQPVFDHFDSNVTQVPNIDQKLREKFSYLLSEITWPSLKRCLLEGKTFLDYSLCQMTCIRILEILPAVFGKLFPVFLMESGDFKWLCDLIDWGKSQLKVIVVYWKRVVNSVLTLLKQSCDGTSVVTVENIESLISSDDCNMDELTEKVSCLCVSLSKSASNVGKRSLRSNALPFKVLRTESESASADLQPFPAKDTDVQILGSRVMADWSKHDLVVLSDDEMEKELPVGQVKLTNSKMVGTYDDKSVRHTDSSKEDISRNDISTDLLDAYQQKHKDGSSIVSQKLNLDKTREKSGSDMSNDSLDAYQQKRKDGSSIASQKSLDKSRAKPSNFQKSKVQNDNKSKIVSSKLNETDPVADQDRIGVKNKLAEPPSSKHVKQACNNINAKATDTVLKQLVHDVADDPLENALKSVKPQPSFLAKSGPFVPKRQLIQLKSPFENQSAHSNRMQNGFKRLRPPRLDDWYKPILEIDYFAAVGLASPCDDYQTPVKLKEVPLSFQSPEQYVAIFRPLVLEEFKAQLHSSFLEMSSWEEMYYGCLSVLSVERVDDFHLVRFVHDDDDSSSSKFFSENDLVLLTRERPQKTTHDIHMIGKVERRERDSKRRSSMLLIRFYLQNGTLRLNQARRNLLERSKWHASHIMNMTPQLREFQALSSLKDIPLLPVILKPVSQLVGCNEMRKTDLGNIPQPLRENLKSSFNDSQLEAIRVAIGSSRVKKDYELSLIQGPPGTGKTRTIVAIVSALLAKKHSSNGHSKPSCSLPINSRPKIGQSAAIARAWQDAALARQLNEDMEKDRRSVENSVRGRVLICAQSNAAVDELVSRISNEGLYGADGRMYKPYLVRVGNIKTVHQNSLPFFIDTLVDHRLTEEKINSAATKNDSSEQSSTAFRTNLEKLVDRIRFYEAKRANIKDGKNSDLESVVQDEAQKGDEGKEISDRELELKLRKLYEQKKQIYKDLSAAQLREKKSNEETKTLKLKLRRSILKEAEIVVTTLSGCGGDLYGVCSESITNFKFSNPSETALFDAVVIDEAAQALEPATLIPLQLLKSYGTQCIMVGDPKQLPATVLSNTASKFSYECSMFERLQKAGHAVVMLTKQYRMHPEICRFPSFHFYESKLLNGEQMSTKSVSFHGTEGLGPYVFYDIIDGRELRSKNSGAFSLYNEHEAEAAVELLKFFKKRYPSEFVGGRIGIITPYKCQLQLLRSRFSSAFGSSAISDIEFNTVDGFQGREVDILILSTVRAADSLSDSSYLKSRSIGFVADVRRMNVALTRARLSLWILGNAKTLQNNTNWAALVKDAKERNRVIPIRRPYGQMFKSASRKTDYLNDHSTHLKDGDVDKLTRSREHKSNVGFESKMVDTDHKMHKSRTVSGEGDTGSSKREHFQSSHRRSRDKRDFHRKKRNHDDNRQSKNTAVVETLGLDSDDRGCEGHRRKSNSEVNSGKRKDKNDHSKSKLGSSGPEAGENNKQSCSDGSKSIKKPLEGERSRRKSKESPTPTGGRLKDHEVSNKERDLSVGGTADLIAKRKQQREAVDAILYSSLISSKKSEPSAKSAPSKRSHSPTSIGGGGIKPSKKRKGMSSRPEP